MAALLQVLDAAFIIPGVRSSLTPAQRDRLGKKGLEPTLHERATLFLLMIDVLTAMGAGTAGAVSAKGAASSGPESGGSTKVHAHVVMKT